MSNKGKILWCIWAGILVLLFLMSSTDLIIKEKEIEVYPVSVIIDGDNDDYYVNLKKGMEQAAVEFHGDVSFITLYADHDQAQQNRDQFFHLSIPPYGMMGLYLRRRTLVRRGKILVVL